MANDKMEITITRIAKERLHIESLEKRWSDSLDFYDCAVWNIKEALEEAYKAGLEAGKNGTEQTAYFEKKAANISEVKNAIGKYRARRYFIEETVELEYEEYYQFSRKLMHDHIFITERKDKMFEQDGITHCILVKAKDAADGILVDSSGYDYARYAAYYSGE